jgi:hypothetical protein
MVVLHIFLPVDLMLPYWLCCWQTSTQTQQAHNKHTSTQAHKHTTSTQRKNQSQGQRQLQLLYWREICVVMSLNDTSKQVWEIRLLRSSMWLAKFFSQRPRRREPARVVVAGDDDSTEGGIAVVNRVDRRKRVRKWRLGRKAVPKESEYTFLHALSRNWAWEAIVYRCESHPSEASDKYVDTDGDNALHWVSFGRPPANVVRGLLSVCPDLVKRKNMQGLTPLHGKYGSGLLC